VVNPDGTLAHGNGVDSIAHVGTGLYNIYFSILAPDISQSAYLATCNGGGEIGTQQGIFPNEVLVNTYNNTGASVDNGFYLAVIG
jgi:hypothetical protein